MFSHNLCVKGQNTELKEERTSLLVPHINTTRDQTQSSPTSSKFFSPTNSFEPLPCLTWQSPVQGRRRQPCSPSCRGTPRQRCSPASRHGLTAFWWTVAAGMNGPGRRHAWWRGSWCTSPALSIPPHSCLAAQSRCLWHQTLVLSGHGFRTWSPRTASWFGAHMAGIPDGEEKKSVILSPLCFCASWPHEMKPKRYTYVYLSEKMTSSCGLLNFFVTVLVSFSVLTSTVFPPQEIRKTVNKEIVNNFFIRSSLNIIFN